MWNNTLLSLTTNPHAFFEALAYAGGVSSYLYLRRRFGDPLATPLRWAVFVIAIAGAALGSKVLYWLEDPALTLRNIHDAAYLLGGKTIVGALFFGLAIVELSKRSIGLRESTGDLYAIPLALGIAIGRIGCFLAGLPDNTYGTATSLPWGVDFGDGIRRHPTQLYEAAFLVTMIPCLYWMLKRVPRSENVAPPHHNSTLLDGDVFKLFMVCYASFRLLCDFIKPYPRVAFGLGTIQWACVLILLYYSNDLVRWLRWLRAPAPTLGAS